MTRSTPVREDVADGSATARQRYGFSGQLARTAARHPWLTVCLWALLIFGAVVAGTSLEDSLTQDSELSVETESGRAEQLLEEAFMGSGAGLPAEYVVVEGDGTTVDDEAFAEVLARLTTDLSSLHGVNAVVGPDSAGSEMVSQDGTVALLQVTLDSNVQALTDHAEAMVATVERVDAGTPLTITAFGEGSVSAEFDELAESTLRTGEAWGMPIALLILILVFGAVVAAVVPIIFAVAAIVLAVGMTALVGQVTDLSFFVVQMITMIGLAIGIDYTLFIIQRYREERVSGRERLDAIAAAGGTATRAVMFSGITVVIAMLGMLLMPDTLMRSLGIGSILVVLSSLALSMTLLPAVLGLLGDRVDRLRLPFSSAGRSAEHRLWARIAGWVTRRPAVSVAVGSGVLLLAATPFLGIQSGNNFIAALPEDSPSRHAFEVMSSEFSTGGVQTEIVIIADDLSDPAVTAAADGLVAELEADPVYGNVVATREPDGSLLLLEATTLVDPSSNEGLRAVERLRDDVIPVAFDGVAAEALVTGPAASTVDYNGVVHQQMPYMLAFVLGLSFLLLLVAFRSIVVPLKAILMNLLSVGASYGLLVAVFQHGWGAELLGFRQVDVIETWIPVMLFAILFGLSMDYHVFLLSRIKERYDLTGDNSSSVAFGLGATGAIITGAALIMVAVFAGFAIGDLVPMQQVGFGLGIAVILDATIVRGVLVPATMVLLGARNWYFPRWLEWLPRFSVEGHQDQIDEELLALEDGLRPAGV